MSERRPQIFGNDAYVVTLEVERTEEEKDAWRWIADDGTIVRFLDWQRDNECYPFRGGTSGPGYWTNTFPAEFKHAIVQWAVSEGLIDDD